MGVGGKKAQTFVCDATMYCRNRLLKYFATAVGYVMVMAMAMHPGSSNEATGSVWTRRTRTVVMLGGRCCGPCRRSAVTLQAGGASQ